MSTHDKINAEFTRRGLLPMDGYCVCDRCEIGDFDRKDMSTVQPHERIARRAGKYGTNFCQQCIELMYLSADDAANPNMRKEAEPAICHYHVEHQRVFERVRGVHYNNWCPHCNGHGQSAQEQST